LTLSGIRGAIRWVVAVLAIPLILAVATEGRAQGKLDARYDFTLAGVSVGRGSWVTEIGDDYFSTSASGQTAGMMRVLASGRGQSFARGAIVGGQVVPATYRSSIFTDTKYNDIRMAISGGVVREFAAEPSVPPIPNRVPLTEAHRRGVSDPMSAALFVVPGTGSLFTSEACARKLSIFDGRMRYDLHLTFKRIVRVKAEKGYQGNAVVCSVIFTPVAGYVPDRAAIQYVANLREIEAWFAPIAGTRVLAPFRVAVPTPLGMGVMQATQFVSNPQAAKPSASATQ
jgi:hypothetical protein